MAQQAPAIERATTPFHHALSRGLELSALHMQPCWKTCAGWREERFTIVVFLGRHSGVVHIVTLAERGERSLMLAVFSLGQHPALETISRNVSAALRIFSYSLLDLFDELNERSGFPKVVSRL